MQAKPYFQDNRNKAQTFTNINQSDVKPYLLAVITVAAILRLETRFSTCTLGRSVAKPFISLLNGITLFCFVARKAATLGSASLLASFIVFTIATTTALVSKALRRLTMGIDRVST